MKGKNKFNGVPFEMPDEVWNQVKDEKHVKGILIPDPPIPVPPEVQELEKKKAEKASKAGKQGKQQDEHLP
jgi:hypothetical protein